LLQRGFGHASVYKTITVDLQEGVPAGDAARFYLHNTYCKGEDPVRDANANDGDDDEEVDGSAGAGAGVEGKKDKARERPARPAIGSKVVERLDVDGLPAVGQRLRHGDAFYVTYDEATNKHRVVRHKDLEPATVDEVRRDSGCAMPTLCSNHPPPSSSHP
jgi:hypothetical protein